MTGAPSASSGVDRGAVEVRGTGVRRIERDMCGRADRCSPTLPDAA